MEEGDSKRPSDADLSSRARGLTHPFLDTVADRVEYIAGLMSEQTWNHMTTRELQRQLSDAWGVTKVSIRAYSAEASRGLLENVRERRAELAKQAVETLIDVATARVTMPGDRAAKVAASKTLLEFAGVDRPDEDKVQKHLIAGVGEATPDKAREIMKSLFGDVTPDGSPADMEERGKS